MYYQGQNLHRYGAHYAVNHNIDLTSMENMIDYYLYIYRDNQSMYEKLTATIAQTDNPGRGGRFFEMVMYPNGKNYVSGVLGNDGIIFIYDGAEITVRPVECKTGGGQVDNIIGGDDCFVSNDEYVVYFYRASGKYSNRFLPPLVFRRDVFEYILSQKGCTHIGHDSPAAAKARGYCAEHIYIQPSSKVFYELLQKYGIPYDNNAYYVESDFPQI